MHSFMQLGFFFLFSAMHSIWASNALYTIIININTKEHKFSMLPHLKRVRPLLSEEAARARMGGGAYFFPCYIIISPLHCFFFFVIWPRFLLHLRVRSGKAQSLLHAFSLSKHRITLLLFTARDAHYSANFIITPRAEKWLITHKKQEIKPSAQSGKPVYLSYRVSFAHTREYYYHLPRENGAIEQTKQLRAAGMRKSDSRRMTLRPRLGVQASPRLDYGALGVFDASCFFFFFNTRVKPVLYICALFFLNTRVERVLYICETKCLEWF